MKESTKKGYWMAMVDVTDEAGYPQYIAANKAAFDKYGAKFLVRGDPAKVYEHGVMGRVVVIEFESVQAAIAVHDSPGYQAALKALGDGAVRDLRIVEGL